MLLLACTGGPSKVRVDGVILVTIDTCRADRIGCYGHRGASTPTIDRLAGGGLQFARCFTQVPTTLASHATIHTSLYPRTHGVPRNGFPLDGNQETIAQIFEAEGFRTAAFVGSFPLNHIFGLNRGFSVYDDETEASPMGGELERRADRVTERAAEWLAGVGDEPFFLWVHYFDPHWPYDPPEPFGRFRGDVESEFDQTSLSDVMAIRFRRVDFTDDDKKAFFAAYDGEIAYTDRNLERLLDAVPPGRGERLLVAVTSDHGEGFGEHNYFFDHGDYLWESGIHVPLILHSPALFPESKVIDAPVRLLDLAPTLLEGAGIDVPRRFEGESLLAARDGELESRVVFSEASKPWNVEITGEYQNKYKAKSIRTDRWKLIVTPFKDGEALYDLDEDLAEWRDVLAREPERGEELEKRLIEWMKVRDPGFREDDLAVREEIREKLKALGYY